MADGPDPSVPIASAAANWQYQVLSRKSADIATALAANRLAGILAGHLKAREIIGQTVYDQATNYAVGVTEYARVEHLITAVLTKTKYNPQCYHDFIQVLELDGIHPDTEAACSLLPKAAMPPAATTTSSSGRDAAKPLKAATSTHTASPGLQGSQAAEADSAGELSVSSSETRSLFPKSASASGSGSNHEILAPQDQNDTSSSFPYLKIGNLSRRDRLTLQSKLLRDSDNIMLEFCDLKHHTINSLVSSCVSVKKLHTRLSGLGAYRPTHKPVPLLQNQLDEIERAEDVEGVFSILDKYYSFFNYVIIEKLIGWFGTPEDKKRLETYTENFKTFCKRRTFECPPNIFGQVDKGMTTLVVKVEESWDPTEGCPLENVLRLRNSLGDILGVESETLYLSQINEGCMELQFQVPSFVEEDIFPLTMEQERLLTAVGVTRLTCGSYSFPQPPEALVPQMSMSAQAETQKSATVITTSSSGSEEKPDSQEILMQHFPQLSQYLTIEAIIPYLVQENLLPLEQVSELILPTVGHYEKVGRLLLFLPRSRPDFLELFINCLRQSTDGTAHEELAKELERAMANANLPVERADGTAHEELAIELETAMANTNLPVERGEHDSQEVLMQYSPQLRQYLQCEAIIPYLVQKKLLTHDQLSKLILPTLGPYEKVERLLLYLSRSQPDFLEIFIDCLRQSPDGPYHDELANKLERAMANAKLPVEREKSDSRKILMQHIPQLSQYLTIEAILPYLRQKMLFTYDQESELMLSTLTHYARVQRLILFLPRSRPDFLELFIDCLRQSTDGTAHEELANELERAMVNANLPVERAPTTVKDDFTQTVPAQHENLERGGYDCEFVRRPPAELHTECPICLQVLREPQLISCCGFHFCWSCIEPIKSCPLCKRKDFTLMHDTGLERSLIAFKVHCVQTDKETVCGWTGELRQLNEHLNLLHPNVLTRRPISLDREGGHSPSLRELDQLPVATVWYRLGLQLGVRADDLDMIKNNYPRVADMCKIKMFAEWLRGDTNPTYEKLVRALAAVGKRKLAESVCSAQGISPSVLDVTDTMKIQQSHGNPLLEPEGSPLQKIPQISSDSMDQQKPTLKELQKYVVLHVASKWEDLGIELNLDDDGTVVNSIRKERGGDEAKCCLDVMKSWLQGKGEEPKTWRTLVNCLREIEAEEAIRSIEENILQSISATNRSQFLSVAQPSKTTDYTLKLKPGERIRSYQLELAEPGIKGENYIIYAPTGTGKTLVAGLIISEHLQKGKLDGKTRKVIFMVNTKPLAQQQMGELQKMIPGASVKCCTGDDVVLSTIQLLLKEEDIIVCTAGKFLNELSYSRALLNEISLIIVDECHHTHKNAPYAKVMGCYLGEKQSGKGELPQVVGLTASLGAGDDPRLDLEKTLDHLYSLCALMDATSGIKTVTENIEELEKHTNTFRLQVLPRRDCSEVFIARITEEMASLETMVDLRCPFQRWSQQYETTIQQKKQPLEMELNPEHRDAINTLKLLRCYSQTLNIYMDLRYEDAIAVLDQFSDLPTMEQATPCEKKLIQNLECLKSELVKLPKVRNPLLIQVAEKLNSHFSKNPESKGICFVRTKKHAHAMCDWISKLSSESGVEIRPKEFIGHTRETGWGMTQVDQEDIMKGFQEGKYNILVATSVAEEGLNVPACDLVIRFQHVSNKIARKQTLGRARAVESEGYTIPSSDSTKEIKNNDLDALVTEALQYLTTGEPLRQIVMEKQEETIRKLNLKRLISKRRISEGADRDSINLKCKVCKAFACNGSDIYKAESIYVVSDEDFKENIIAEEYHSPMKTAVNSMMARSGTIFCKKCGTGWGRMCIWPSAGYELPFLKCKNFIFEIGGYPRSVKKWSEAPFEIPPLSSHPKYKGRDN